jgi:hypothetical protein
MRWRWPVTVMPAAFLGHFPSAVAHAEPAEHHLVALDA